MDIKWIIVAVLLLVIFGILEYFNRILCEIAGILRILATEREEMTAIIEENEKINKSLQKLKNELEN